MNLQHFKTYWSIYLTLFILGICLSLYLFYPPFTNLINEAWQVLKTKDEAKIAAWFKAFGIWGPIMIITLMVVQMFLIVFPTWLPMIIAVLAYGPYWGILISIAGILVASTLGYWLGMHISKPMEKKLISKNSYGKISSFMEQYGFGAVVLFRISPFLSNDAISFITGIMRMGYAKYMLATMVGIMPLAIAIAYFSSEIARLKSGLFWIGGFGVVMYIAYIFLSKRLKAKNKQVIRSRPEPNDK